jgi:hypothetical protein
LSYDDLESNAQEFLLLSVPKMHRLNVSVTHDGFISVDGAVRYKIKENELSFFEHLVRISQADSIITPVSQTSKAAAFDVCETGVIIESA